MMSIRSSAFLSAITSVAATCMLSMPLSGQQASREGQKRSAQITAELKEMHDVSKQLVSVLKEEYKIGNSEIRQLLEAQHELLELELKLSETPAERMNVLVKQLNLAKDAESAIALKFESGSASRIEVLQAQIARMKIELAMLDGVAPKTRDGNSADIIPATRIRELLNADWNGMPPLEQPARGTEAPTPDEVREDTTEISGDGNRLRVRGDNGEMTSDKLVLNGGEPQSDEPISNRAAAAESAASPPAQRKARSRRLISLRWTRCRSSSAMKRELPVDSSQAEE